MKPEVWRKMGLRDDGTTRIKSPGAGTNIWSWGCSASCGGTLFLQTFKAVVKTFPTTGPRSQGPGENAGVVSIGDGRLL